MKKLIFLTACLAMIYPLSASAVTGLAFGGKIGYATYKGDVLPSSGDVGKDLMFGAVIEVSTFPVFDLELQLNYFTTPFQYSYSVGGQPVTTTFDFRDINAMAFLKKNLIALPASPLSLYVGAGLGFHVLSTEVALATAVDPSLADDPFALVENAGKVSGQGLIGFKVSPPVFPLAVFGEGRFGQIFAEERISMFQIEGGLLLKF